MARIAPLPRSDWPPEMLEALSALLRPTGSRHPELNAENRPQGRNIMNTFALHPDLTRAFFTFNGHALFTSTLTPREREMVVLRVAVRRESAYLWGQHWFNGLEAGLTDQEMRNIASKPEASGFEPVEIEMLRAVDELVDDGAISATTWSALDAELDDQQLLDLIFTAGLYETVAWFFRSVDLEVDPDIPDAVVAAMTERT